MDAELVKAGDRLRFRNGIHPGEVVVVLAVSALTLYYRYERRAGGRQARHAMSRAWAGAHMQPADLPASQTATHGATRRGVSREPRGAATSWRRKKPAR